MSTAPRYIPHYTVDDYQIWEGDWELIDGVAIAMGPSPFGHHERIISRLSRMIGNEIDAGRCPCEIYTNLDWIVKNDTVIRPDLMVLCGQQPQRHLERPPALMVEVLSASSRTRDETAKRTIARENGVRHYWIIDPDERIVFDAIFEEMTPFDISTKYRFELTDNCTIKIDWEKLFDSA